MKLEKAVEILEQSLNVLWEHYPPDRQDAVKLGIEALKKIEDIRICHPLFHNLVLPGETEEVK